MATSSKFVSNAKIMNELIIASSNSHKVDEIKSLLPSGIKIYSLLDLNYFEEIIENGATFHQNAQIKAKLISEKFNVPCLADDSGLVVESLNGEPGIYSARYAGEPSNNKKNIELLLQNLQDKINRNAYFITIICWVENGNTHFFESKIEGKITFEQKGEKGFGYDPIFIPNGFDLTFAEMSSEEKNKISHRNLAIKKFINFYSQKN